MTTLTIEQQQRMEALSASAALLVDRSESGGNVFAKGGTKTSGLIPAAAEHRDLHLASATVAAIDLADYIISGPEPEDRDITIDEDGMRVTS